MVADEGEDPVVMLLLSPTAAAVASEGENPVLLLQSCYVAINRHYFQYLIFVVPFLTLWDWEGYVFGQCNRKG